MPDSARVHRKPSSKNMLFGLGISIAKGRAYAQYNVVFSFMEYCGDDDANEQQYIYL